MWCAVYAYDFFEYDVGKGFCCFVCDWFHHAVVRHPFQDREYGGMSSVRHGSWGEPVNVDRVPWELVVCVLQETVSFAMRCLVQFVFLRLCSWAVALSFLSALLSMPGENFGVKKGFAMLILWPP